MSKIIAQRFSDCVRVSEGNISRAVEDGFRALARVLSEKIARCSFVYNSFASFDERLYDEYAALMNDYRAAVDSELLAGDDPMLSRLLEPVSGFDSEKFEVNPVGLERKAIALRHIRAFEHGVMEISENFIAHHDFGRRLLSGGSVDVWPDFCFDEINALYAGTVQAMISEINNTEQRKCVVYYVNLLTQEEENLNSVIGQMVARPDPRLDPLISELEYSYSGLKKMLDFISSEIAALTDITVMLEPEQELQAELAGILALRDLSGLTEGLGKAREEFYSAVKKDFDKLVAALVKKLDKSNLSEAWSKAVSQLLRFGGELECAFLKIAEYALPENIDGSAREIVKGVVDTMKIKAESINESCSEFTVDMDMLIQENSKPVELSADGARLANHAGEAVFNALLDNPGGQKEMISAAKAALASAVTNETPAIAEKIGRIHIQRSDTVSKKMSNFTKDSLLYECSTFEEIEYYSVNRLCEISEALDFITLFGCVSTEISEIITRNGIEFIRPQPHDFFSGKEHEILAAEKNDEFKTGEIIKRVNNGYRRDEVVILRANVIAAK